MVWYGILLHSVLLSGPVRPSPPPKKNSGLTSLLLPLGSENPSWVTVPPRYDAPSIFSSVGRYEAVATWAGPGRRVMAKPNLLCRVRGRA